MTNQENTVGSTRAKRDAVTQNLSTRTKQSGGGDINLWKQVAIENGTITLLNNFIAQAETTDAAELGVYTQRSITLNYQLRGKRTSPVFCIHPYKGSRELGVWFGWSGKNLKAFGFDENKLRLPSTFENVIEWDGDPPVNDWHFGYLKSEKEIFDLIDIMRNHRSR